MTPTDRPPPPPADAPEAAPVPTVIPARCATCGRPLLRAAGGAPIPCEWCAVSPGDPVAHVLALADHLEAATAEGHDALARAVEAYDAASRGLSRGQLVELLRRQVARQIARRGEVRRG